MIAITAPIHYADVRDAVIALRWGPIHLAVVRRGLWRVEAAGRVGFGPGPGSALLALLIEHAAAEA